MLSLRSYSRELTLSLIVAASLWVFSAQASTHTVSPTSTPAAKTAAFGDFEKAVAESIRQDLVRKTGALTEEFHVEIESLRVTPSLPQFTASSRVEVMGLGSSGARRLDGLFNLSASIFEAGDGLNVGQTHEVQLSGVLKVTGPVYIAKNNLPRGRILETNDLSRIVMPWRTLPTGAAGVPVAELLGRRVRAMIVAGEPVFPLQLDEPFAVKSGDPVELVVMSGPGVIIRSRGIAKQEGRVGDLIRIEQPDTKKVLSGQIVGDKSVEVRL